MLVYLLPLHHKTGEMPRCQELYANLTITWKNIFYHISFGNVL